MKRRQRPRKNLSSNRLAIIGITIVVLFLAIAINIRGKTLRQQVRDYQAQEESLDAAIANEEQHGKELEEKKVYVKTKEFTMEKAREIFGLKLPDEIIIKPDEK